MRMHLRGSVDDDGLAVEILSENREHTTLHENRKSFLLATIILREHEEDVHQTSLVDVHPGSPGGIIRDFDFAEKPAGLSSEIGVNGESTESARQSPRGRDLHFQSLKVLGVPEFGRKPFGE